LARSATLIASAIALCLAASAGLAQQDGGALPRRASVALEVAHRFARALPVRADTVVMAAQGTQEGHWRFVNRTGEMFTVGTPEEMQRVVTVLYPEARPGVRVALYMTEDTVFRHGAAFKALPANAEIHMVTGGESYRLLRRADPAGPQLYAEVRPNLAVELRSLALMEEAFWHLARPLGKAGVRLLALEPGGPMTLPPAPRIDAGARRALVDAIDPAGLVAAIGGASGQTLVILGRVERDLLFVRAPTGPERSVALDEILRAADAADVNLLVLQTASTPRQPSGSHALWQDGRGSGSDAAEARLADLLNALAGPSRRFGLAASSTAAGRRAVLDLTLVGDLTGASAPHAADARFAAIAGELASAGVYAVRASLLSADRQSELDQRLIRGIPAVVQAGYAALFVLGLIGAPVARTWWARVWPPEASPEYAGRAGYWAACTARGLAFALVFLPLTALVAAPYNLGGQIWGAVGGPARWWARVASSSRERKAKPRAEKPRREKPRREKPRPETPRPRAPEPDYGIGQAAPPATAARSRPAPAPQEPPQREPRRQPARSWIAELTTREDEEEQ
jgi:hypothetical protein